MATYRILVVSLKRLYQEKGEITLADVQERLSKGSISQEEYNYIIG